jgi:Flagellar hook capping protein
MSDLVLPIKNGKVAEDNTSTSSTSSSTKGQLGKEAFMQLLVAQMKYQDPLEPASNTEYISQLATFSELEQMQSLNATAVNSQAFSLVGKEVIVGSKDSSGNTTTKQGVVDFITISNNKTYLSIDNNLYPVSDLQSVSSDEYIAKLNGPVVTKTDAAFDLNHQKDIDIKLSLGSDKYAATSIAVVLNGKTVDKSNLSYADGVLTIKKEALKDLSPGKYKVGLQFDDYLKTYDASDVTVTVTDSSKV